MCYDLIRRGVVYLASFVMDDMLEIAKYIITRMGIRGRGGWYTRVRVLHTPVNHGL